MPPERAEERFDLLETESHNSFTDSLDSLEPEDLVALIYQESRAAYEAVGRCIPEITAAIQVVTDRLKHGGRLFYVGAGTSGRLGVLDATECPPTFGTDQAMVQAIIAGGETAITSSVEGAEDSESLGAEDLQARNVATGDVVVGIAASGRTPYVLGALHAAREVGAATIAVVNVAAAKLSDAADITIAAVTGPEVLTGSTRLNAGSAQKLILNMISTASMVRLGKVYRNLMVDVRATNAKLQNRALRIVEAATGVDRASAEAAMRAADGEVKTAIVMICRSLSPGDARRRLQVSHGFVRIALEIATQD